MFVAVLSIVASLAQQPLVLPPAYYDVAGIAKACAEASGEKVVADSSCAADLYAVSLHEVSWPDVRTALALDRRLEVTKDENGTWHISRSPGNAAEEKGMQVRYMAFIDNRLHKVFTRSVSETRYIASANDTEKARAEKIYGMVRDPDPVMGASNELVYQTAFAREVPFSTLGFGEALTGPKKVTPLGARFDSNVYDSVGKLDPIGNVDKVLSYFRMDPFSMDVQTKQRVARQIGISTRMAVEPVGAWVSNPIMFYGPSSLTTLMGIKGGGPFYGGVDQLIVPARFPIELKASDVFTKDQDDRYSSRMATTAEILKAEDLAVEAGVLPTFRVAKGLLKWASKNEVNLIYYVSPYTDFKAGAGTTLSIVDVVRRINANRFEEPEMGSYFTSVTGNQGIDTRVPALRLPNRLTLERKSGVLVVRNEMRFLDTLCPSPALPSVQVANNLLADKNTKLLDLARAVSAVSPNKWTAPHSSQFHDLCDPVAFKPFALAIQQSPQFLASIAGAKLDDEVTIAGNKLDTTAVNLLRAQIKELAAAYGAPVNSYMAKAMLDLDGANAFAVVVRRRENDLTLEAHTGGRKIWSAEVHHVTAE